jgi:NAD-dependent deacetylase
MPTLTNLVLQATQLLVHARDAGHPFYAFTGAGVSTDSGLPDFRSRAGLWSQYDAMAISTTAGFCENPELIWKLYVDGFDDVNPQPNTGHLALAQLEQMGLISAVVTQNVDSLHEQAGSRTVHHLHGDMQHAFCLDCEREWPIEVAKQRRRETGEVMRCTSCETPLQPSITLFEQPMPVGPWDASAEIAQSAGGVMVCGSSLAVAPAHFIPLMTVDIPRPWIVVNRGQTQMDHLVGDGDVHCSGFLSALVLACEMISEADEELS